jgi:hypothetical protein
VGRIREQQAQLVTARRQRDFRLGLAGAKMKMIEIVGNRLVERRQIGVDQKVMVSGVGFVEACRRDAHIEQAEADHRVGRDIGAVGGIDEVDLGVLRRGLPLAGSGRFGRRASLVGHLHLNTVRHQRRRVRNVVPVGEHQLHRVLARRQGNLGFGLAGAEVQMLEVVRYLGIELWRRRVDDQVVMT